MSNTRKRGIFCLVISIIIFNGTTVAADSAAQKLEFTFGVVPQFEARELAGIWVPLLRALEQETGYVFSMVGAPRIPEFETAFLAGEFDFAYMNPYHSLQAATHQNYRPLVRDSSELYGVLVVAKDSPFNDLQSLQNRKIAFPAPNALGASLLMRAELEQLHDLDFQSVYTQTHTSSYLNVLLGETDAAGGVMRTFQQLKDEYRAELRIVYETRRVPTHPVVAHPRVPVAVTEAVQAAILKLSSTAAGRELLARVPMPNPIATSSDDYSELADMDLEKYYVAPVAGSARP